MPTSPSTRASWSLRARPRSSTVPSATAPGPARLGRDATLTTLAVA
ncbi:hypothetical protein [Streptomyces sp. STR69]|nr:hypothetical protein [Streptomyces sp. STR69]